MAFNACSQTPFEPVRSKSDQKDGSSLDDGQDLSNNDDDEPTPTPTPTPIPDPDPTPLPTPTPTPTAGAGFVAVGHMGSSLYSCDGLSWRGYQSQDNNLRCWDANSGNVDCDHSAYSSMGVAYGPSGFVATFGWGVPGRVQTSDDGTTWQTVQQGSTWSGVAAGNNTYILNDRSPLVSNNGTTWQNGGALDFVPWNSRRIFFVPHNGGVFIAMAESNGVFDLMISRDNGRTFRHPTQRPSGCGNGILAHSANRIVLLSQSLCVSTDAGETWQVVNTRLDASQVLYDGQEFRAYGYGTVARSTDGLTWTHSSFQVNGGSAGGIQLGEISRHPATGRYVAISQDWAAYYEKTQYYYSDNGLNWIRLNKAAGAAPVSIHPVRQIAAGYVKGCP